jgi:hypothetical protein
MNFLALYRGESIARARLVAVSSEPEIVRRFLRELAGEAEELEESREQGVESLRVVHGD